MFCPEDLAVIETRGTMPTKGQLDELVPEETATNVITPSPSPTPESIEAEPLTETPTPAPATEPPSAPCQNIEVETSTT